MKSTRATHNFLGGQTQDMLRSEENAVKQSRIAQKNLKLYDWKMHKPKLTKLHHIQHLTIKLLSEEHQNTHQNDQIPTKDKHIQVPTDKAQKMSYQQTLMLTYAHVLSLKTPLQTFPQVQGYIQMYILILLFRYNCNR
jgi:hypothetical protein